MDAPNPTHGDIITKQAVMEAALRFMHAEMIEFKAASREWRNEANSKLDVMGAKIDTLTGIINNLRGQRTILASVVAAVVSIAVAIVAALIRKM